MADAVTDATRIIFLANPNNPTGTIYTDEAWRRFLRAISQRVVIVVDEAYAEYVDHPDYPRTLQHLGQHAGLVVLRTFSKIYGLAGLRVGYAIASSEIAGALARLRQPFNVGSLGQVAAAAALEDHAFVQKSLELGGRTLP